MRSEHRHNGDEQDAFSGWRKVMIWRPGQRKRTKQRSHRRDRRTARQRNRAGFFDGDFVGILIDGLFDWW